MNDESPPAPVEEIPAAIEAEAPEADEPEAESDGVEAGDAPRFFYLHLMDAHGPYRPADADLAAINADTRLAQSFPGVLPPAGLK